MLAIIFVLRQLFLSDRALGFPCSVKFPLNRDKKKVVVYRAIVVDAVSVNNYFDPVTPYFYPIGHDFIFRQTNYIILKILFFLFLRFRLERCNFQFYCFTRETSSARVN